MEKNGLTEEEVCVVKLIFPVLRTFFDVAVSIQFTE